MSESYSPNPESIPAPPYNTVFLSQRDLGLDVPVNYITHPGVSFTAACFPNLIYEDDSSGDCFSNLLASGFRRFELDLYWDQGRQVWSFCPVAITTGLQNVPLASPTTANLSSGSSQSASISSSGSSASNIQQETSPMTTVAPTTRSALEVSQASSLGTGILSTVSVPPDTSNEPLMQIGPYMCTSTINLSTFTSLLLDWIEQTETTLDAHILYITLNMHATASSSAPESPAPQPSSLPGPTNLLGSLFMSNMSTFIYTQANLESDRANLNGSWYTVSPQYRPVQDYYTTTTNQYGITSSEDGWPSESYIEFSHSKRLLLGWGNIDPQMANYNFSVDSSVLFPKDYIQDIKTDLTSSTSGGLATNCYLRDNTDDLSEGNSSWAVSTLISQKDLTTLYELTSNITNCGISPFLNTTLLNVSADDNYIPYQNFSYATIWSWAPDEPKTHTNDESHFRCATASVETSGRWIVSDCSQKYYAACRATSQPLNWTITTYPISYSYASQACPPNYTFSAPRTSLENAYLTQALSHTHRDYDGHGVWVDFNALDVEGCWTTGGENATCPYSANLAQEDDLKKRVILVPTIAALIVLVVTALTVFIKASGNRKVRKRATRRGRDGYFYEGVPS